MLRRMVLHSLLRNGRVSAWTLMSLGTCATLVTLFTSVSLEVETKMNQALRRMGANAVAYPRDAIATPAGGDVVDWPSFLAVARRQGADAVKLSVRVGLVERQAVPVIAVDPTEHARMTPYWLVSGRRPESESECLVGRHLAESLGLRLGQQIGIEQPGADARFEVRVVGIAESGDEDEDRLFVGPGTVPESWSTVPFTYSLVAAPGGERALARLKQHFESLSVPVHLKPLRQVLQGEQHVLSKIRLLCLTTLLALLLLTTLGVCASALARVAQRRKELTLLQALGARSRSVIGFLLAESASIGVAAALLGFVFGTLLAQMVARQIFHVSIAPHALALLAAAGVSASVSLFAGAIACNRTLHLNVAATLKGE